MSREKTLNQIIDIIQRFVDDNLLINSFSFGTYKQINSFIENNDNEPFLYVIPNSISLNNNTISYRFEFIVVDSRSKDKDNLIDILSDTAQILLDLRQYFIYVYEKEGVWSVRDNYTRMTPAVNITSDWMSGWRMEMDIESVLIESDCLVPLKQN